MGYGICLIAGIVLFLLAILDFYQTISRIQNYNKTEAEVVRIEKVGGSDNDTYYTTFKYKTNSNVDFLYTSDSSSSDWLVGETVKLAYNPSDPSEVILLTYMGAFSLEIVLLAISLPMISVGAGYFLLQRFLI